MGLALGPFPLDFQAKVQAGQAVLYVTNGFKCAIAPQLSLSIFCKHALLHANCPRCLLLDRLVFGFDGYFIIDLEIPGEIKSMENRLQDMLLKGLSCF